MLKQQAKLFQHIAILTDLAGIIIAFVLAYLFRNLIGGLTDIMDYLWVLLVVIPIWFFLLAYFGLYASLRTLRPSKVLAELLKIHALGGMAAASLIYMLDPHQFSRGLFVYFLLFSYIILSLEKSFLKAALWLARKRGYNTRHILIIGADKKAGEFIRLVEHHAGWGLRVLGVLQLPGEISLSEINGYRVLGRLDDLVTVCRTNPLDEVVFCVPKEFLSDVEEHLRDLEEMGITVRMVLDFYDAPRSRQELTLFHDSIPMLTFYCRAFDANQLFLKRCLDVLGSCVGLMITACLFPLIALAIKLDSPGAFFFGQERVGENGRIFKCWKFRSMYVDAEEQKKELMRLNEMNGAMFKIKDDPRTTRVGHFLRKTSLDELPQFWNVLRGEMSLVGTRPPTQDEVATYENWHHKRICIKPGITGLWQVSGRNQIHDFDEVVRLDIEYIERWTLWLDIKLLCKTLWVVLAGRGAS